jgi:hypothetical protein
MHIGIAPQQDFNICQYEIRLLDIKVLGRKIRLLTPTCLGGFFAEYSVVTYGMVSAPMSTWLTRITASPLVMGSAENRDGSKLPRYLKPSRVRFCNGWIRLPSHAYITDAPVTLCLYVS